MEESPKSLLDFVPINLQGVDILLVHDDKVTLNYLSFLLEQYSFKVTVSNAAAEAISIICNEDQKFKLVMAKANMPDMNIIGFLDVLLQRNILLICTYSGGYNDVVSEALTGEVIFMLQEPIRLQDLKDLWQHVYHRRENAEIANPNTSYKDEVDEARERQKNLDENEENSTKKIAKLTFDQVNFNGNDHEKRRGKSEHNKNDSASEEKTMGKGKKRTRVWTPELHQRFTQALSELSGRRNPKVKEVLDKMNVPHLTVRQVASHMQRHKYKMQHGRDSVVRTLNVSSNTRGRTEFPTPLASSRLGTTGVTALPTSLIQIHDRSQFIVDVDNPPQRQETLYNATSRFGLSTMFSNHRSDAIVGIQLPTTSRSQNQSLLRALDNMRNACIQNYMPTASGNQNKSIFQPQKSQGNATSPSELPALVANYGSQDLDSIIQNNASGASDNQNNFTLELQQHQSSDKFANGLQIGMMNYRSQNLGAFVGNPMLDASTNQNQPLLHLQDNTGNATFKTDIPLRLFQYGNQSIGTVAQNHVPTASVDQNRYLNQLEGSRGNATFSHEVSSGFVASQSLDFVTQNHVREDLLNQNQSLQLQQNRGNASYPYGPAAGLANYRCQNADALVENPVPTSLLSQSQSFIQYHVPLGNVAIPSEPLTGFANYGCQNEDFASASVNENPSSLQYQHNHGNASFPYEFPTRLDNDGNQNHDAVAQNLMPDSFMNYNNQSFQPRGTQDNANFHCELATGLANFGSQYMKVAQNTLPTASVNQNKYPFQLPQGHGTFSSELPTGLTSYGSQNLDILTQSTMPAATSMITNEFQGNANSLPKFPIELANHESQNVEVGLRNHVPTGLTNYRSQNLDADVNYPVTTSLIDQIQSHGADNFEWLRVLLLEDN